MYIYYIYIYTHIEIDREREIGFVSLENSDKHRQSKKKLEWSIRVSPMEINGEMFQAGRAASALDLRWEEQRMTV